MGTRNRTIVISNKAVRISQYGQWDGYFKWTGRKFLKFCYNHLSNETLVKNFKEKVEKTRPIFDISEFKEYADKMKESTGEFLIPFQQLFPQFHRNTGVDILNIILNLDTFSMREGKYFPLQLDTDTLGVEYVYIINLDEHKIYMLSCYEVNNKCEVSKETKKVFPTNSFINNFDCFLSYDLYKLPKVEDVLNDYNNQGLDEEKLKVETNNLSIYLTGEE